MGASGSIYIGITLIYWLKPTLVISMWSQCELAMSADVENHSCEEVKASDSGITQHNAVQCKENRPYLGVWGRGVTRELRSPLLSSNVQSISASAL
jgi:hypothetical protein